MDCFSIPKDTWTNWEGGYSLFKYKTIAKWFDVRKGLGRILNKITKILQSKKQGYLPPYKIYGGSLYSSFPRYAVKEILSANILSDLKKRLKWSLCGE